MDSITGPLGCSQVGSLSLLPDVVCQKVSNTNHSNGVIVGVQKLVFGCRASLAGTSDGVSVLPFSANDLISIH
jgi:hypothetical protein